MKNSWIFSVILALLFVFTYFYKRPVEPFFPRLSAAGISPSKLERILQKTEGSLEKEPVDLLALVDRGVAHFHMGPEFYDESHDELSQAWRSGAFDKRIFYYLGILYENLSVFEEAEKQYRRFLNHEPKDLEIRLRLARLKFRLGNWQEAIDQYGKLVKENPNDVTSILNFGLAYQFLYKMESSKKGKYRLSEEKIAELLNQTLLNFESASRLNPELPKGISLALAEAYVSSRAWDKAVRAAETEISKYPGQNDKEAYKILAQSYQNLNLSQDLLKTYQKLSSIDPKDRSLPGKIASLKKKLKVP